MSNAVMFEALPALNLEHVTVETVTDSGNPDPAEAGAGSCVHLVQWAVPAWFFGGLAAEKEHHKWFLTFCTPVKTF